MQSSRSHGMRRPAKQSNGHDSAPFAIVFGVTDGGGDVCFGPARGLWTNLGRLPLRVFSIGKYAFQKKAMSVYATSKRPTRLSSLTAIRTWLHSAAFSPDTSSNASSSLGGVPLLVLHIDCKAGGLTMLQLMRIIRLAPSLPFPLPYGPCSPMSLNRFVYLNLLSRCFQAIK